MTSGVLLCELLLFGISEQNMWIIFIDTSSHRSINSQYRQTVFIYI